MTRILLVNGDQLEVDESFDDVVRALENAARSSAGTLARLAEADSGDPVALNVSQVALVRPSDT